MSTHGEYNHLKIVVIIPSLKGDVSRLKEALIDQTWAPDCIHPVFGVRPNGRARNQGVADITAADNSGADQQTILIFIDDDALPGNNHLIEALVKPLLADETIGITGAARVLPANANWFQRRVAAEIPRTVNEIPVVAFESNPNTEGYGHSQITTTCCAMRQELFVQAGGFCEALTSGVDTDFFYRVRKLGYRFIMVPDVYVEHPAPGNLSALLRKFYWYGIGYGQETQLRPEQHMGPRLDTHLLRLLFIIGASIWVVPNIFFLYSYGYPRLAVGFRPLKAMSTYAVAWGYVKGWQKEKSTF